MSWKSTIEITRKEAIQAIISSLDKTPYDEMTNEQLEDMMYQLDIGDDVHKPYYGHNFIIRNNEDEIDNVEKELRISGVSDSCLSREDRFKLGIKKYGFDSDFMREYNSLRMQIRYDEDDEFFNKWNIER